MAAAAPAVDDPAACVLRAVDAGVSAEELRRVIDDYASGGARTRGDRAARRLECVNYSLAPAGSSTARPDSKNHPPPYNPPPQKPQKQAFKPIPTEKPPF